MFDERLSGDTTVVAIGDSAMWGTGTDYRFKPPNLVHKMLNGGTPIPPVQLRARGGGVIGKTESTEHPNNDSEVFRPYESTADGNWDPADDDYGYSEPSWDPDILDKWRKLNENASTDSANDINDLKWSIRRDIGRGKPTHLQQLDQFAPGTPHLDVPGDFGENWGSDDTLPVRFYRDESIPDPENPRTGDEFTHRPNPHPPDPAAVDLVLVNGGTNDVGLAYMMDPTKRSYRKLMNRIAVHCHGDAKHLLEKTRDRFPNALIVLLGYPMFLSEWTSYKVARKFLNAFPSDFPFSQKKWAAKPGHLLIERVVDGGMVFARAHQHYMRKAVAERSHVEAREGHPGVMYVSRGFGVIHAFAGPDTWAWSLGDDDTFDRRKHFIEDIRDFDRPNPMDLFASIGHPNRKGSIETAKAILDRYGDRRHLSVGDTAEKIDRRDLSSKEPRSLKEALRSWDGVQGSLFPNSFGRTDTGSVTNALSHRYVDSMQLKFHRDDSFRHASKWEKIGRTKHLDAGVDLYLDVEPGRNGNRETYRVDWESDRNARDTPQFDRHSGKEGRDRDGNTGNHDVVTEVNIDPMAGRQINGTVNTNYGKDRSENEDNVYGTGSQSVPQISWSSTDHGGTNDLPNDRDDFQPGNRWDADRLMLWQVRQAHLRVENPGFWTLREIEFTINGELTFRTGATGHGDLERTFKKATQEGWDDLRIKVFP